MRVFFMAFEQAGQTPLTKKLRAAGHKLAVAEPRYPDFFNLLKQQSPPPEAFVVDCSLRASHARESCNYLKSLKTYRDLPFILYNVKKEDEPKTRERVTGAVILANDAVEPALSGLAPRAAGTSAPP